MTKDTFKYAKLYDPVGKVFVTDNSKKGLVMGKETQKRYDQNDNDCAVTVCCITYNHENTIRQTLDGFISQKTNFVFQVFVGEDQGTDSTADIIREYAAKYPDIIIPFIREKNMGAQRNLIDLCQRANSPYIAFCEGDDYWIDDEKLQKQFDYMQAHEEVRMCYTQTRILAPEDWHLNDYYKHEKDGSMIIPGCAPGFKKKSYYTVEDFLEVFPNHTSSAFYRWNYDLVIPEWYYHGIIGDIPITLMQMGMGKAVYLPYTTSVYRRSDVGIFMNTTIEEHFQKTRLDYVRFLSGLRTHFNMNYGSGLEKNFRKRISQEITNYLRVADQTNNLEMVNTLMEMYPSEALDTLHTYVGTFDIYSGFQRKLSPTNVWYLSETKWGAISALPGLMLYKLMRESILVGKKIGRYELNYVNGVRNFWKYSKKKKDISLWVFTGFRHEAYMDNTKYLYEYILENHPEIHPVWLTTNRNIYRQLKREGKPTALMNTPEGRDYMSRAAIAVTDHFTVTDYPSYHGFNAGTRVVQLWHGVGFKSMGDEKGVKNTAEKGVRYSDDILPLEGDSELKKAAKKLKYYFQAPFRERFEEYYMFVCPGTERIEMIADIWKIPEERRFMAGHPRNLPVYSQAPDKDPVKVIYAPTYRFDPVRETNMVEEFLEAVPQIQELMTQVNGKFAIRMHPHTWRNYERRILEGINGYDRIELSTDKDIYETLGTYSVLISDYSSIALDFAMFDRPVIFHGQDYEWFKENEAGFNLDYPNVIPGPLTANWQETLEKVKAYIEDPSLDEDLRHEKIRYFFDQGVNGPDNSERIIKEIKRRLKKDLLAQKRRTKNNKDIHEE